MITGAQQEGGRIYENTWSPGDNQLFYGTVANIKIGPMPPPSLPEPDMNTNLSVDITLLNFVLGNWGNNGLTYLQLHNHIFNING